MGKGGKYNSWSQKRLNSFIKKVVETGISVQACKEGYTYKDNYTGLEYVGKTPAEAFRKSGRYLPDTCPDYCL